MPDRNLDAVRTEIGLIVLGNYLWLEFVALSVLAGTLVDDPVRRSNAILWTLLLMFVSALGPGYFLSYDESVRDALRAARWWHKRARAGGSRLARRRALWARLRARRLRSRRVHKPGC